MSKVTPIKRQPEDLLEQPTLAIADNDGDEHIESLCKGTLIQSLHGVMLRIEEAQEAAGKLPYGAQS